MYIVANMILGEEVNFLTSETEHYHPHFTPIVDPAIVIVLLLVVYIADLYLKHLTLHTHILSNDQLNYSSCHYDWSIVVFMALHLVTKDRRELWKNVEILVKSPT